MFVGTVMFVLNFVFFALLAPSTGQSGKKKIILIFLWLKFFISLVKKNKKVKHPAEFTTRLFDTPDILPFTGIPQYIQDPWIISDEDSQYKDTRGLAIEEKIWPESPPEVVFELVTVGKKNLPITSEPYVLKEQGG